MKKINTIEDILKSKKIKESYTTDFLKPFNKSLNLTSTLESAMSATESINPKLEKNGIFEYTLESTKSIQETHNTLGTIASALEPMKSTFEMSNGFGTIASTLEPMKSTFEIPSSLGTTASALESMKSTLGGAGILGSTMSALESMRPIFEIPSSLGTTASALESMKSTLGVAKLLKPTILSFEEKYLSLSAISTYNDPLIKLIKNQNKLYDKLFFDLSDSILPLSAEQSTKLAEKLESYFDTVSGTISQSETLEKYVEFSSEIADSASKILDNAEHSENKAVIVDELDDLCSEVMSKNGTIFKIDKNILRNISADGKLSIIIAVFSFVSNFAISYIFNHPTTSISNNKSDIETNIVNNGDKNVNNVTNIYVNNQTLDEYIESEVAKRVQEKVNEALDKELVTTNVEDSEISSEHNN